MRTIEKIFSEKLEEKRVINDFEKKEGDILRQVGFSISKWFSPHINCYLPDYNKMDFFREWEKLPLPLRFMDAELENCQQDIQDMFYKNEKREGLFLYGNVGAGKTYTIYAVAKTLIANDYKVKIANSIDLLNHIRSGFSKTNDEDWEEIFNSYKKFKGVLIIDDFGVERITDWVAEMLYSIINYRYENCLITFFTSNFNISQIAERVGDRITSRIVEMCKIVELKGKDRRLNK